MMWLNPENPERDAVAAAIREAFASYGVEAVHAMDVDHDGVITDVILEQIRDAEFLVADLTGERPSVYYEVGYAHGLGKRPILIRRKGTKIHFDLSLHNTPEYEDVAKLHQSMVTRLRERVGPRLPVPDFEDLSHEQILSHKPRARFLSAIHLPGKFSQVVDDPAAMKGEAKYARQTGTRDHMVYGPYEKLRAGDYVAVFRVKVGSNTVPERILRLDVRGAAHGQRDLRGTEFSQPLTYQTFAVPFKVRVKEKIEYRVLPMADDVAVWVDYVAILRKTPPRSFLAWRRAVATALSTGG